ncbi:MAG: enterochelin esterase [Planctomycetes bacterium]|nr:enterochelin esterase [Planctomycetota bacterium]
MNPLLTDLEKRARTRPREVDALLAQHTFPVVEGRNVTFVFRGDAEAVRLQHWIHGLQSAQPLARIGGTNLWALTIDLPEGSRMEYKLEVEQYGHRRLVQDPLNPHLARDPYGANSVVYGAGYAPPEWTLFDAEARQGEIVDHWVQSDFLGKRPFKVYLPARFRRSRRYPLLVAHDGEDYMRFAGFKTILDNLVHRLEIPPLVVALIQSPDRLHEYAADDRHARFLVHELVPLLENEYPLVAKPTGRALMGASFGAVASLHAAWKHPRFFDLLALQSGSFVFTDIGDHQRGPLFDPVVKWVNEFRASPGRPSDKLFVSCGKYESLIYYNRSLVPLLQKTGMQVEFSEAPDGHNWENWRDRLREALCTLFPGPLWHVYE